MFFRADAAAGRASASARRASRSSWSTPEDIPWADIAFPSTDFALRRYLEDRAAGREDHHFTTIDRRLPRATREELIDALRVARGTIAAVAVAAGGTMTFVVTENCIKCKYMDCVEVCPVDCFHEGPNFLAIDPDECIDCTLCEPECPVEAIFSGRGAAGRPGAVQAAQRRTGQELAGDHREEGRRRADAKEWEGKPDKLKLLER